MELFLLALLAAVAASDKQSKVALPQKWQMIEPDDSQLRAEYVWHALGYQVEHWNELQEGAWLLDRLLCPDGHIAIEKPGTFL